MKYSSLKRILPLAALSMLAWSCSDHAPDYNPAGLADEGEIRITLHIPVASPGESTRAYPTGGADGDGREEGLENENQVFDANIFFFKQSGFNPVRDASTVSVACVYVTDVNGFPGEADDDPFEKKITLKVKSSDTNLEEEGILTDSDVGFVTVLNAGNDLSSDITNLSQLRAYTGFSGAWKETAGKYSEFVMTTAYDANSSGNVLIGSETRSVGSNRLVKTEIKKDGDKEVQWIGETTVQRICGRVDLMYPSSTYDAASAAIVYSVKSGAKVYIKNLLPVNFMTKPSYLLSKVTEGVPTDWTETGLGKIVWGGVETTGVSTDRPANYVIEPTTLSKLVTGATDLSGWYGTSAASAVKTAITKATNGAVSGYSTCPITALENNGYDQALIVGYPNENVQSPACYKSDFITGLIFRAEYRPKKIIKKVDGEFVEVEVSDEMWSAMSATEKSFWRYQPIAGADGVSDSDALYFSSENDAKEYMAAHKSDLAEITAYPEGICYYNLWLRHYNDESYKNDNTTPKETYPMEYAIVRNNIYRVSVGFSGPGDPQPELREPDTMKSRIFVRKWNQRSETNPIQF